MSSGACRALVAVVITLVATMVMTLPVVARSPDLSEGAVVTYEVAPATGKVRVRMVFTLSTGQADYPAQRWGPIVVESAATPSIGGAASKTNRAVDVPGLNAPWEHIWVRTDKIDGGRNNALFRVSYNLDAAIGETDEADPVRVDPSYFYLCVPGQEVDSSDVTVKVSGSNWEFSQSGTPMQTTTSELSLESSNPGTEFTCIEGVREARLAKDTIIGPADREIELQAWASDPQWLVSAARRVDPALNAIHEFLAQDIPGEGPVIIREAPVREAGGYASQHDSPGVVQLDETGGTRDIEHQMAHAWFVIDIVIVLLLGLGSCVLFSAGVTC